jgi:hypothetical protein
MAIDAIDALQKYGFNKEAFHNQCYSYYVLLFTVYSWYGSKIVALVLSNL